MKGSWPILIYCAAIRLERLRNILEISQNNRSYGGNINPGPPKYEIAGPQLDRDVRWCQYSLTMHNFSSLKYLNRQTASDLKKKKKKKEEERKKERKKERNLNN